MSLKKKKGTITRMNVKSCVIDTTSEVLMAVTVVGGYTYISTSTITQPYVTAVACNVTSALVEKPVKIQRKKFVIPISSYDINTDLS